VAADLRLFTRDAPEALLPPVWEDVQRVLRGLDGDTRSEAHLGPDEETGICVVGGPERYVLWVQRWVDRDIVIDTAIDPNPPTGSMSVTLGNGQVDEIPLAETVDLATTLRAARTYFENQSLDGGTAWQHQGPPNEGC
jgi:hypothetical protein